MTLIPIFLGACQSHQHSAGTPALPWAPVNGLHSPQPVACVQAICSPPLGWRAEPLKHSRRHNHQVWLSPSGKTAYGVICVDLPFPVGADLMLWGFLREMRQREGDAVLLSRQTDEHLPGLRFAVEGGRYALRANLRVQGWRGWVTYAGTLRQGPVACDELRLAEEARDHTQFGLSPVAAVAR